MLTLPESIEVGIPPFHLTDRESILVERLVPLIQISRIQRVRIFKEGIVWKVLRFSSSLNRKVGQHYLKNPLEEFFFKLRLVQTLKNWLFIIVYLFNLIEHCFMIV